MPAVFNHLKTSDFTGSNAWSSNIINSRILLKPFYIFIHLYWSLSWGNDIPESSFGK